ncbi:MAG TPA: anti-sigma factor [Flavobacteriales bacterium]|jgi:anti-sigma-K factor RskA|nr:anti-sigma factor [Flavobacteriales bacterium]
MNAQELIASGLLEAYVLGEGSPEERALVERMAATEPTVRAELDAIERTLEAHAMANAVKPAAHVRAAVLETVRLEERPIRQLIAPGPEAEPTRSFNWLAAASIAALFVSAAANFFLYRKVDDMQDRLARIDAERTVLAQELQVQRTNMDRRNNELAVMMDPAMQLVDLKGMNTAPDAKARIYWDPTTRVVQMGPATLPPPPKGMQYQLWAMVEGKPVDAGVMPLEADSALLHRMKDIGPAEAFAVTLEKEGGMPTPDLSALVLMGHTAKEI